MDKPLHVQVAEVLGQSLHFDPKWKAGPDQGWYGDLLVDSHVKIPRYDTDWSTTGPLIEKYRLTVVAYAQDPNYGPDEAARAWFPGSDDINDCTHDAYGPTPLIAACNLILALHKAGGLP